MELRKGYPETVKIPMPTGSSSITGKVYKDGTQVGSTTNLSLSSGFVNVPISYAALQTEGRVRVDITFHISSATYTKSVNYDVITPYLELYQIRAIVGDTTTDADAWAIEASARYIIDTVVGHNFGNRTKTIVVRGTDEGILKMPERIISFSALARDDDITTDLTTFDVTIDNGYIKSWGYGFGDQTIVFDDVISYPWGSGKNFSSKVKFSVTGVFGWETVPDEVVEAAKLLVNDYSCKENMYRDRYLESISTADWKLVFNDRTFEDTGNARADQLLAPFKVLNWAVV